MYLLTILHPSGMDGLCDSKSFLLVLYIFGERLINRKFIVKVYQEIVSFFFN